jgi:hypothetical protein
MKKETNDEQTLQTGNGGPHGHSGLFVGRIFEFMLCTP